MLLAAGDSMPVSNPDNTDDASSLQLGCEANVEESESESADTDQESPHQVRSVTGDAADVSQPEDMSPRQTGGEVVEARDCSMPEDTPDGLQACRESQPVEKGDVPLHEAAGIAFSDAASGIARTDAFTRSLANEQQGG